MLKKVLFFTFLVATRAIPAMEKLDIQKRACLTRFLECFCGAATAPFEGQPEKQTCTQPTTDNPKSVPILENSRSSFTTSSAQPSISEKPDDMLSYSQDFIGSLNAPPSLALSSSSPIGSALRKKSFEEIPLSD